MIFFDFDGTLLDSNGVWLWVDQEFLGRRGRQSTEEYAHAMAHSIFPMAAQITKDYFHLDDTPEEIMDEWQSLAYEAYANTIPLKTGAIELLEKLRGQGQRMALLTAGQPKLATAAVKRHRLDAYLEGLFFSQEVGLEKRVPQVYRLAAQRFGVSPDQCVLLEDGPENCAAAREAGFRVIGVYDDFFKSRWEEVQANSHRTVKSLTELLEGPLFQ